MALKEAEIIEVTIGKDYKVKGLIPPICMPLCGPGIPPLPPQPCFPILTPKPPPKPN